MRIRLDGRPPLEIDCDAVIIGTFEGEAGPPEEIVGPSLAAGLQRLRSAGVFTGKLGKKRVFSVPGDHPRDVVIVGLGPSGSFGPLEAERAAAAGAYAAAELGAERLEIVPFRTDGFGEAQAVRSAIEGCWRGAYRFDRHKTSPRRPRVNDLVIAGCTETPDVRKAVETGRVTAEAVALARDLVNEPPDVVTPTGLAEAAIEEGERAGLEVEALDAGQIEQLSMGAFLSVARGSAEEPRLVVMRHGEGPPAVALVGKGVTYDSGGLAVKPLSSLVEMKRDMAGGAAVIGAMCAIGRARLPVAVLGLVPAAENMSGAAATKPGSIVRAMDGTTIEITNTDAEGRLLLADGVAYARHLRADRIVDIATLTGACRVALGGAASALVGNDEDLQRAVESAAARAGERVWRLPAFDDYREALKSSVADLVNSAGRSAAAITAALFVGRFAGDIPWAHLDIAGTAWRADKGKNGQEAGATGVGVRTLFELARLVAAGGEARPPRARAE